VPGTEPLKLWLSVVAGEGVTKSENSVKIDWHFADSVRFPDRFNHRKLPGLRPPAAAHRAESAWRIAEPAA
jgi:hypothetical protein